MLIERFTPEAENLTAEFHFGFEAIPLTSEQKAIILQELEEGQPQHRIAKRLGLPPKRVYAWIYNQRAARKLPIPNHRPDEFYRLAQTMWEEGKSVQQIADAYEFPYKKMYGRMELYRKFGWFAQRRPKKKLPKKDD